VVVELNTLPGLTAGSLVPKAVQAAGMSMTQLLERLMERSLWRAGQGPGGRVANAPG
jgi:D-alanine-D-alanine ligase